MGWVVCGDGSGGDDSWGRGGGLWGHCLFNPVWECLAWGDIITEVHLYRIDDELAFSVGLANFRLSSSNVMFIVFSIVRN